MKLKFNIKQDYIDAVRYLNMTDHTVYPAIHPSGLAIIVEPDDIYVDYVIAVWDAEQCNNTI